jgi:group I intron endonuclease
MKKELDDTNREINLKIDSLKSIMKRDFGRFCVYKIFCKSNNKSYIGITIDFKRRFNVHWNSKEDTVLNRSIKKYGRDNFEVTKIDYALSWEEACDKERYYILQLNTKTPHGMNMTNGGDGIYGLKHTEESKKKMSESHMGKAIGKDNPMYGKPGAVLGRKHTEEEKRKISESKKGKISWNKGKKLPQFSGENAPFYGKHHTKEAKEKLSKAHIGIKASEGTKLKMSKMRKGVYVGGKHSQAKLTNEDIIKIKEMYNSGQYTQRKIGDLFKIDQSMVSRIILRKSWKHI